MPGEVEGIARIRAHRGLDLARQIVCSGFPCLPESSVNLAASTEVIVILQDEVKISNPVLDGATASEGDHEPLVGVVRGQETGCASKVICPIQSAVFYSCYWSNIQIKLQQHLGARLLD